MVISLVVSTGGIAVMPLYARNLLPPTVVSRPLEGDPPTIEVSLGYKSDNPLPQLPALTSRIHRLKAGRAPGDDFLLRST